MLFVRIALFTAASQRLQFMNRKRKQNTVEPLYNEVLGTMKIIYLVILGFSLYQGKKKKEI